MTIRIQRVAPAALLPGVSSGAAVSAPTTPPDRRMPVRRIIAPLRKLQREQSPVDAVPENPATVHTRRPVKAAFEIAA
ncbi:hypothetical protein [Tabrizicola thermarum]|uniref:hypothetical protein n=1 Tax=Tabrizicola thermarum TaxID=2670345 RepID=UPI000FFC5D25|nr:hypothetical protein [Tabrizicola thermarum]